MIEIKNSLNLNLLSPKFLYLINTQNLDEDFIKKVHQKTGKDITLIEKAVMLIKRQRKTFKSTEADLIDLNSVLEKILDVKSNRTRI